MILSVPFYPYQSVPFRPYHFLQYNFALYHFLSENPLLNTPNTADPSKTKNKTQQQLDIKYHMRKKLTSFLSNKIRKYLFRLVRYFLVSPMKFVARNFNQLSMTLRGQRLLEKNS